MLCFFFFDINKATALLAACKEGLVDIVKMLVSEFGADLSAYYFKGTYPLMEASRARPQYYRFSDYGNDTIEHRSQIPVCFFSI